MDSLTRDVIDYQNSNCCKIKANKISNKNIKLIKNIASKLSKNIDDFDEREDARQNAFIIFFNCMNNYDHSRCDSFISYFFIALKREMFRCSFYEKNIVSTKNNTVSYTDITNYDQITDTNKLKKIDDFKNAQMCNYADHDVLDTIACKNEKHQNYFFTKSFNQKISKSLSEIEKNAIKLRYFSDDDLSTKTIASKLYTTDATIRIALSRAKNKLKSIANI